MNKMSLVSTFRLLQFRKTIIIPAQYAVQANGYAAPVAKKPAKGRKTQRVELPVEKDVNRLVTHVCGSNIYKTGEDVKLKPDSEYPDWLWNIRTSPAPTLEELDPNTKQYWRRVRKLGLWENNRKAATRKF